MIKHYLLTACLLISTFCQARIDRTLSNNKTIMILEGTDTYDFRNGIKIAFQDFIQIMRKVSFKEFDRNMHTLMEPLSSQIRESVLTTMNNIEAFTRHLSADKSTQTFWMEKYQRPYFFGQDIQEDTFEVEQQMERITTSESSYIAQKKFFYCYYEGNYYLVSGVSTPEDVVEVFESVLNSLEKQ